MSFDLYRRGCIKKAEINGSLNSNKMIQCLFAWPIDQDERPK